MIFSDFLCRTYLYRIHNNEHRAPRYSPESWNMHDSSVNNLQRTNNAQEGWHSTFRKKFVGVHPPLSKSFLMFFWVDFCLRFIRAIKTETDYQYERLRLYEIDHTLDLSHNRPKKYKRNDEAIRTLIVNYDNNPNKDNPTLIHHLHALQF